MKIVLFIQEDRNILPQLLDAFIKSIKEEGDLEIAGCILTKESLFGKPKNIWKERYRNINDFGLYNTLKIAFKRVKIFALFGSVSTILMRNSISVLKTDNPNILKNGSDFNGDILVSVLGNNILTNDFLSQFKYGGINLHSGDLPYYRGLTPTFWACLNGEDNIGISLFKMDAGIDTGQIILKRFLSTSLYSSWYDLSIAAKRVGLQMIVDFLKDFKGEFRFLKTPMAAGSYYGRPKREDFKKLSRVKNII